MEEKPSHSLPHLPNASLLSAFSHCHCAIQLLFLWHPYLPCSQSQFPVTKLVLFDSLNLIICLFCILPPLHLLLCSPDSKLLNFCYISSFASSKCDPCLKLSSKKMFSLLHFYMISSRGCWYLPQIQGEGFQPLSIFVFSRTRAKPKKWESSLPVVSRAWGSFFLWLTVS